MTQNKTDGTAAKEAYEKYYEIQKQERQTRSGEIPPVEPDMLEAVLEGIDAIQSKQEEQARVLDEILACTESMEEKLEDLGFRRDYLDIEED